MPEGPAAWSLDILRLDFVAHFVGHFVESGLWFCSFWRWEVFSHEKLSVYQKALICVLSLNGLSCTWDKRHALVDHLVRASESILMNLVVMNIAEGNGHYGHGDRRKFLDTAEASAAKSAAYLDLCCQGGELEQIGRIAQMLHVMTDG